jgi:hypothetical protein
MNQVGPNGEITFPCGGIVMAGELFVIDTEIKLGVHTSKGIFATITPEFVLRGILLSLFEVSDSSTWKIYIYNMTKESIFIKPNEVVATIQVYDKSTFLLF